MVSVRDTDWSTTVNARTAGQAKYDFLLNIRDVYPDIKYTDIRVRKLGMPRNTSNFEHVKTLRGVDFNCGDRVRVLSAQGRESFGHIVGCNGSANFEVLFDADDDKYPNMRYYVHPSDIEKVE